MKLELKHLAPYLPYGLNVMHSQKNMMLIISGAYFKANTDKNFRVQLLNWDSEIFSNEVKPILKPLSDYTEDYANFWNYSFRDFKWAIINKEVSVLCWHDLLLKHYDVFGLIEKGLAIDINTL